VKKLEKGRAQKAKGNFSEERNQAIEVASPPPVRR
jgi:hypothetical protein